MKKILHTIKGARLLLFLVFLGAGNLLAQPANDDCSNAQLINISGNGYDTGAFYSRYTNLTNATIQSGEKFYSIIRVSGLNQKTAWFKLVLKTARAMRVTLQQSGTSIGISDVGFTTYYTSSGCFPDSTNADSAKLTTINKFGNSYHPCVKPGTYYIQVCSKSSVNDSIQIKVDLGNPKILNPGVNFHPNAYAFGTLAHNSDKTVIFETGCLTIDSASEVSCLPAAKRADMTQSAWFTFRTGSKVDWAGIEYRNNDYYSPILPFFDTFMYVELYTGDVSVSGQSGVTRVGSCLKPTKYYTGYSQYRADWRCILQPNTTYSIKLLFHRNFDREIYLRVRQYGQGTTLSPKPVRSAMNSASILGTLPKSPGGTQKLLTDYFSCESKMFHSDVQCGTENLPLKKSTNDADSLKYNLSTWFRFDTDEKVKLNMYLYAYPAYFVMTIYQDSITDTCGYLDKNKVFWRSNPTYYVNQDFNCFPKGKYSVHIQGLYDTTGEPGTSYFWDYKYRNAIGEKLSVYLTTYKIPQENRYSLKDTLAVFLHDTLKPLRPGISNYSPYDTLACNTTLRPAKSDSCSPYYTSSQHLNQVSWHQFRIGDYNQDNLPDSGFFTANFEQTPPNTTVYMDVFRGNAKSLAQSQNKWSYPDTLTGLSKLYGCIPEYWSCCSNTEKMCVTQGDYTVAIKGNSDHNGVAVRSRIDFDTSRTKYYSRALVANLGDLSSSITNYGGRATDRWTCLNNPDTIAGIAPCAGYTKLIYRQFYIGDYRIVKGMYNSGYGSYFSLFKGKALDSLSPYSDNSGQWTCAGSKSNTDCDPLPPGWYTIVSYGRGPTYGDAYQSDNDLGEYNSIVISLDTFKKPKFNRPHKANLVNNGFPLNQNWQYLSYDNGTTRYKGYSKDTCFEFEQFACLRDTAWMHRNMSNVCNSNYTKVAFYVFRTTAVSQLAITGFYEWGTTAMLYDFDVRKDSARMLTDSALQACMIDYPNGNYQFCDLKAGWYTLVILAKNSMTGYTYRPCIRVEPSKQSRNDYANAAYDFDVVRSDSVLVYGKTGDVHPENSGYDPSASWIYCGTSASSSDPDDFPYCYKNQISKNKRAAARDSSRALFPYYQIGNDSVYRRNLWYTFVLQGSGNVNVTVEGVTNYQNTPYYTYTTPFAIYESNANGVLNFDTLRTNGQIDSTKAQGLRLVMNNIDPYYNYCGYLLKSVKFNKSSCNDTLPKRYYILVEDPMVYSAPNGDWHIPLYTNMYRVGIKYDGDPPNKVSYDHYSQANVINGLQKTRPPYKDSALRAGTYKGAVGHFVCATKDTSDQNTCGRRTIWYKFQVANTGIIRISYDLGDGTNRFYNYGTGVPEFMLFREVVPGDSTSTGLVEIPYNGSPYYNNGYWFQSCITAGTYYLMFKGCYMTTANSVIPTIQLIEHNGDRCGMPQDINVPGAGSYSNSLLVDCHSIGNDWGEGSTNLGCMPGPSGYKSSWFRVNITDTFKYDLTFIMSESTNVNASSIAYRLLVGDCNTLNTGPCNRDLATQFTINCMLPGSYYLQVFTPSNATGNITGQVSSVKSSDQTCQPTFALPVTFLDIQARVVNGYDARVEWTAIEDNEHAHWDVYRSFDGNNFVKIGTVSTSYLQGGQGINTYRFIDPRVGIGYTGEVYYKVNLVEEDKPGEDHYSKTATVDFGQKRLLSLRPNPANTQVTVQNLGEQLIREIQVFDYTGKQMLLQTVNHREDVTLSTIDWLNGVYTIRIITASGEMLNFKQVVQH